MDGYADGVISGLTANRNDGGAFGYGGDWIWIILVFALIWGNNGNGFFGNSNGGVTDGYVLASDFANIERKIDGVNTGICDGFYAMNTGMLNGFAGLTNTITTSGYETRNAITTLGSALQACCCDIKSQLGELKFDMATQGCAIQNSIATAARDIIDSQRDGTAQILSFLTNEKISSLRAKNATLEAQISQNAQTATLINALKPSPVPAFPAGQMYGYCGYGCGATSTCGCGCSQV